MTTKREIIVNMIEYMGLSSACVINNGVVRCLSCDYELKNINITELNSVQKAIKHFGFQNHYSRSKWGLCENKKPYPLGEEFVRIEYEEPPSKFIDNFIC
jgi:hypothetical protein